MHTDVKELHLNIEKAVRLLVEYVPYDEHRKKLIIPHCLRVGFYLLEKGNAPEVVLGGLLHDIIEWTEISEEIIKKEFGDTVFNIIFANTQHSALTDNTEKWQDMVERCVVCGEHALVVKSADVLDSYHYYKEMHHPDEVRRSTSIGLYILLKLPKEFRNPIFNELRSVLT